MIDPDQFILWEYQFVKLNTTIITTWGIMVLMTVCAHLVSRKLSDGFSISRWQHILELVVLAIKQQIEDVGITKANLYLPFVGTLFLFIAIAGLCTVFPAYIPPTSSLSTTTALALCVFIAVPYYGITKVGIKEYIKSYLQPTFIMLPFNIIGEISRTLALAIRLFGNMMSGVMIISVLLSITPFFFPVIMNVLGLLTGLVQAYIFSMLATVFIAAAVSNRSHQT